MSFFQKDYKVPWLFIEEEKIVSESGPDCSPPDS